MAGLMGNPFGFRTRPPQSEEPGAYTQQRAMPGERRALQQRGLAAASAVPVQEYWRGQDGLNQASDAQTAMERYGNITLNELRRLSTSGSREERIIAESILQAMTLTGAYPADPSASAGAHRLNSRMGELRKTQQATDQGRPLPRRGYNPTY